MRPLPAEPPGTPVAAARRPDGPPRRDVVIALGANLGNRTQTLRRAVARLRLWLDGLAVSNVYATAPRYVENQPNFLNMAVRGRTVLAPHELLEVTQQIERDLGRVRAARYGPRHIDLDIVYYDDWQVSTPVLAIPHPLRGERGFVLMPVADVAPALRDPVTGQSVQAMLRALPAEAEDCVSLGPIADDGADAASG
ncbi:MAG: 2-amino-4-hydroxy-6-hydroxymethyldihydropteridine diphosphokinase [Alphaproteobacteria bacterium]